MKSWDYKSKLMYIRKTGLKVLKGFHLMFVSLTLGGVGMVVYLYANLQYTSTGIAFAENTGILTFRIFEWIMNFSFGGLLLTGFIYGMFTHWGFFKYIWIFLKWILVGTIFVVVIIWGYPSVNGLAAVSDISPGRVDLSHFEMFRKHSLWIVSLIMILMLGIVFISTLRPWGKLNFTGIKKRGWVLSVAGLCAAFILYFQVGTHFVLAKYRNMKINPVQLDQLPSGIYLGRFEEAGGPYVVEVTVRGHKITDIKPRQVRNSHYVRLSEGIFQKVKDNQRIDIQGITGATTTSRCYLKAIENALSGSE